MSELYREILEIEALLCEAEQDIESIKWDEQHPDYPESLLRLMGCIARSSWVAGDYQNSQLADVLAHIQDANLDEIKHALTRLNRSSNNGCPHK